MPELPDVDGFRRILQRHGVGHTIDHVTVHDAKVLEGVSAQRLRDTCAGRELRACHRHGKRLAAELGDDDWLELHFGMTGELVRGRDGDAEPRHSRVRFVFTDGSWLAFDCRRKLGRVALHHGAVDLAAAHGLGPDALAVDGEAFQAALRDHGGSLKAALMDQSRVAGIGNVYADEICFRARVHPARKVRDLDAKALGRLETARRQVLERAARSGGDPADLPAGWLVPIRGDAEADCPRCGTRLQDFKLGGRRTRACPQCQG